MKEKLRPCPFCGRQTPQVYDKYNKRKRLVWYAQCTESTECKAELGPFDTKDEAIAAWNRRANPLAVSVQEAAFLLSVSERTVWSLAKQGEIQSRKVGSRVIFPVASIRAFLEGDAGELVRNP